MKPAPFDYLRPVSISEAVEHAARSGADARYLAGGQSLMAMLNMRLAEPRVLIDVGALRDAAHIRLSDSHVAIGCAVRQSELERWPQLQRELPLVAHALPWVGHHQTRSRGTVCGSIAHADPSSELPLCLALLDGEVELQSRRGRRTVQGAEFFLGVLQTARGDDELISEVRLPRRQPGSGVAFREMAIRHGDFALIAVGVVATQSTVRIAIGGAGDRPEVRAWPAIADGDLDEALNELAWSLDCRDDQHATAAYRRHLIRSLGRQTVKEALACRS